MKNNKEIDELLSKIFDNIKIDHLNIKLESYERICQIMETSLLNIANNPELSYFIATAVYSAVQEMKKLTLEKIKSHE